MFKSARKRSNEDVAEESSAFSIAFTYVNEVKDLSPCNTCISAVRE